MSNLGLLLTGLSTISGMTTSISQGYAQKAESGYNSTLADVEAQAIDIKKDIEFGQYQRLKGRTMSTSIANIAASGIEMEGSPMAAMITAQTQIGIDQTIGQYNIAMEKGFAMAKSDAYKREGKRARSTGYSNAFSKLLEGGASMANYYNPKMTKTSYGINIPTSSINTRYKR